MDLTFFFDLSFNLSPSLSSSLSFFLIFLSNKKIISEAVVLIPYQVAVRPPRFINPRLNRRNYNKIEQFYVFPIEENIINNENNTISSELIIEIIKQNQEFKNLLLEQNKTIIELSKNSSTNINNINNNINSNNK